ncbi:MAG: nicotinate (nicotinamide) nucleotide adenylyltransferase [Clostridia bacterium]|nr:nicotinate (nicotinamide) nucleotide adenylyltransferase [Clostridia bacterium]
MSRSERKIRIGIFGGTFSPPHNGHVSAAISFAEQLSIDKLYIIPTCIPPHKAYKGEADANQRLQMCKIAFDGVPNAFVSDLEIKRSGVSYTADTLSELKGEDTDLYLLVGTDMFVTLDEWYKPEKIFENATIVLMRREMSDDLGQKIVEKSNFYKLKYNARIVNLSAPVTEMSSTEVRKALKERKYNKNQLKREVFDYIIENGLYK